MTALHPIVPRLLGLALLCWIAPGCAALNVKEPTASLRSARVTDVSAEGMAANFDLDVQNPNSFTLPLSGANYKLSFSDVQVLEDQTKPTGSLPANGTLPVTLPVRLRFDQLLSAEQAIAKSGGNIPYDLNGSLEFSPGKIPLAGPVKVPLRFNGTLNLRDAVEQASRNPSMLLDMARNPSARKIFEAVLGRKLGVGGLFGS